MKILYISGEYPPETGFGGIGTYTRHAAEGMAQRGHAVEVICRSDTGKSSITRKNGITIHRITPGRYRLPQAHIFYPFRALCYRIISTSLVRIAWAATVCEYLERHTKKSGNFDIVEYPECGAEGYRVLNRFGPAIARLHTPWEIVVSLDMVKENPVDTMFQNRNERISARKATLVTSPSLVLARHLQHRWNLKRVMTYPNPIPSGKFKKSTGSGWIYTGRIERRKGVHILIDAYAAVCARFNPPPLKLVGRAYGEMPDGRSYASHIEKQIASYGLKKRITWIRGVSQSQVGALLSRSAAAFFPSLWENFPYSCLEAMASGLAVVASDCGGYPEMIDNRRSGLLVEAHDPASLSSAMISFLTEPRLAQSLGEQARKAVRDRFDTTIICKQAEGVYNQAREEWKGER